MDEGHWLFVGSSGPHRWSAPTVPHLLRASWGAMGRRSCRPLAPPPHSFGRSRQPRALLRTLRALLSLSLHHSVGLCHVAATAEAFNCLHGSCLVWAVEAFRLTGPCQRWLAPICPNAPHDAVQPFPDRRPGRPAEWSFAWWALSSLPAGGLGLRLHSPVCRVPASRKQLRPVPGRWAPTAPRGGRPCALPTTVWCALLGGWASAPREKCAPHFFCIVAHFPHF